MIPEEEHQYYIEVLYTFLQTIVLVLSITAIHITIEMRNTCVACHNTRLTNTPNDQGLNCKVGWLNSSLNVDYNLVLPTFIQKFKCIHTYILLLTRKWHLPTLKK